MAELLAKKQFRKWRFSKKYIFKKCVRLLYTPYFSKGKKLTIRIRTALGKGYGNGPEVKKVIRVK